MAIACLFVVVIVVSHFTDAFVDTYVYHYEKTKETKNNLADYAVSYSNSRDQLLASYTGDLADTCKSQLANKSWFSLVQPSLQTIMIQNVGQIKTLDTNWFNEIQDCGGDNTCIKRTNETWARTLAEFQCSAKNKIYQVQQNYLSQIKSYMDNCIHSRNGEQ